MAAGAFVLPLAAAAPAHAVGVTVNPTSSTTVNEPEAPNGPAFVSYEATPNCTFTELLAGASATFPITLTGVTATAGTDFDALAQPSSVTVKCGGSVQAFGVTIRGDSLDENDETFTVNVGSYSSTVTILDSDPPPSVTVADAQATTEGTGAGTTPMTFAVALSGPSSKTVSVPYTVTAGTATPGADFDATGGAVTIPAGQTTATITVPVVRDAVNEPSETLGVSLGSPTNAQLGGKSTATGTIVDDDTISFTLVANQTVTEGNTGTTPMTFTVRKVGQTSQAATVHVKTRDGSAGAPSDYQAVPDTVLTFAPGDVDKTVTVLVNGDTTVEGDEVFGLDLFGPSLGTVATATATGTIRNDDTPPPPPPPPPVTTPVTTPVVTPPVTTPVTTPVVTPPVVTGSDTPKVTFRPLSFKKQKLTVSVACPVSEKTCRVQLTVFTVRNAKSKIKQLRSERKIGSRVVIVPGGRSASITLTLSKANAALLKRAKSIPVRAYAVVTDNDGNVGTSSQAGTLRR